VTDFAVARGGGGYVTFMKTLFVAAALLALPALLLLVLLHPASMRRVWLAVRDNAPY
jgi:hypothetical protein